MISLKSLDNIISLRQSNGKNCFSICFRNALQLLECDYSKAVDKKLEFFNNGAEKVDVEFLYHDYKNCNERKGLLNFKQNYWVNDLITNDVGLVLIEDVLKEKDALFSELKKEFSIGICDIQGNVNYQIDKQNEIRHSILLLNLNHKKNIITIHDPEEVSPKEITLSDFFLNDNENHNYYKPLATSNNVASYLCLILSKKVNG